MGGSHLEDKRYNYSGRGGGVKLGTRERIGIDITKRIFKKKKTRNWRETQLKLEGSGHWNKTK